jgi:hypothetical protein
MQELEKGLEKNKQIISLLEKRIELAKARIEECDYLLNQKSHLTSVKYRVDKNDAEILIFKTEDEIRALKGILNEKQKYFEKYAAQVDEDYKQMGADYEKFLAKATKQSMQTVIGVSHNQQLSNLLNYTAKNKAEIELDMELKLSVFRHLKQLVKD